MNNDSKTSREGIERAAYDFRQAAAKNGVQVSQTEAVKRVERAVEVGDKKRQER